MGKRNRSLTMASYTDKEIDLKFELLSQKIDDNHKLQMQILKSIEEQTKKTNGRVTGHDSKLNELENKTIELSGEIKKWVTVMGVVFALLQIALKFVI